jgi:hypothetical protein
VGLERGLLSLVSTIEKLLGRNSSYSGLENREYSRGNPLRWPCDTLYPQKLALTSPTCGGLSFCIVLLRSKPTEFVLFYNPLPHHSSNAPLHRLHPSHHYHIRILFLFSQLCTE